MAVNYEKLANYPIPEVEQTWTSRDTMLYALGLGFGADPVDTDQLKFVYEKNLHAVPSMAVVLCTPHAWLKNSGTGVSGKQVAAQHGFTIHKTLPVAGTFVGKGRVTAVVDKGAGRGVLVSSERKVYEKATGDLLFTHAATSYCLGDGGFGGPTGPVASPHPIPARVADIVCDLEILPQAALIYRLSGDRNPLHADPDAAKATGFARPILHGLCTMGMAGHAILKHCCGYDPTRLKSMDARFSSPVYPGESLRVEIWRDDAVVSFRSTISARDNKLVLNNGRAGICP